MDSVVRTWHTVLTASFSVCQDFRDRVSLLGVIKCNSQQWVMGGLKRVIIIEAVGFCKEIKIGKSAVEGNLVWRET